MHSKKIKNKNLTCLNVTESSSNHVPKSSAFQTCSTGSFQDGCVLGNVPSDLSELVTTGDNLMHPLEGKVQKYTTLHYDHATLIYIGAALRTACTRRFTFSVFETKINKDGKSEGEYFYFICQKCSVCRNVPLSAHTLEVT